MKQCFFLGCMTILVEGILFTYIDSHFEILIAYCNCFFTQRRRERRVRALKSSIFMFFFLELILLKNSFA